MSLQKAYFPSFKTENSGSFILSTCVKRLYKMLELNNILKNYSLVSHVVWVTVLLVYILYLECIIGGLPFMVSLGHDVDPWLSYGTWLTIFLYSIKFTTFLSVPQTLLSLLGVVMRNTSPPPPRLMSSLFLTPFICFRVVTRGLFPELVKKRVNENLELCRDIGLQNFQFEVVTDNAIGLKSQGRVKEIVVPPTYKTKNDTLFKARALQYCLEENVSIAGDSDWIVHLDEETRMTESSVIGVVNFINDGKYDFGQGVITYGKKKVVNWLTTLADSVRTGFDYGVIRFTLGTLHRPVFSWKGSFVVARASAERQVTFDFGPEGSLAEDCYFALKAWSQGFRFNFIEGDMLEESPFTTIDLVRQRRRWISGIYLTFTSTNIPWRFKFGISLMVLAWFTLPLQVANVYFAKAYPIPVPKLVHFLQGVTGGTMIFMFFFGADRSFYRRRRHLALRILINVLAIVNMPLSALFELTASVWHFSMMLLCRSPFYFDIVQKDNSKLQDDV